MAESESFEDLLVEHRLPDGRSLPIDFTDEDVALAVKLNATFDIEREELPPRFAQTLLNESGCAPVAEDFEARVTDRVWQTLELEPRRPVAARKRPAGSPVAQGLRRVSFAVLAVGMLLTANAALSGQAVADMIHYLFVGQGGVKVVNSFPQHVQPVVPPANSPSYSLNFAPLWVGQTIGTFTYTGMDVYPAAAWSSGALTLLHYEQHDATGTHQLAILEFVPDVHYALQVVQNGAAIKIPVGATTGVYVSGQWEHYAHGQAWKAGDREELIYAQPGQNSVVTWIATDLGSNNGATQSLLVKVAQSFQVYNYNRDLENHPGLVRLLNTAIPNGVNTLFGNDVIVLINDGSTSDPAVIPILAGPPTSTEVPNHH